MSQGFTSNSGTVNTGERAEPRAGKPPLRTRILRLFARVTTSGAFIPEIDGLRFIAIAAVVLFHLFEALQIKAPRVYVSLYEHSPSAQAVSTGYHGVELFFVISGFVLALPFASHYLRATKRVSLRGYFLRRLTRLEPPYLISLLLIAVLLAGLKGEHQSPTAASFAASAFYLHNVIFGLPSEINTVAWSLEIEIQFYVLVPLLTLIFSIRKTTVRRAVLIGTIVGWTICAWLFLSPDHPRSYLSILRFLQFFLTGFLLADFYLCARLEKTPRSIGWDFVSALGWCTLVFLWMTPMPAFLPARFPTGDSFRAALLFPPLALLTYVAAFRGRITNWIITNPLITVIGGMCYTIYLLHNVLISAIVSFTREIEPADTLGGNFLVQCLIVIPVVLAICAIYFLLIEKPCMQRDWPKRLHHLIGNLFRGSR